MFQFTQEPPEISLQGLPFIFKIESTQPAAYLKIMAEPLTGLYELLSRNSSNIATFDLRSYFESLLKTTLYTDFASLHYDACKSFIIDFHEYYGNPPEIEETITSTKHICIGTVPDWKKTEFDIINNTFANRLLTNHFLTWWPIDVPKKVLPAQIELMYFVAPAGADYAPSVSITYDDSVVAHNPGFSITVAKYQMASIPVGYEKLGIGLVDPAKKVVSYTVTVAGQSRTYLLDHAVHRDVRYIIFQNSLGGFDTLACTGEADESTEVERLQADRVYNAENPYKISKREFFNEHIELVKVNTGWLSQLEKNWLNDLLISKEVYEVRGTAKQAISIKNKSIDRTWRMYEPGSIEIEFERLNFVL